MGIPTQGLTEKMQLSAEKLNAQRAAIHAEQNDLSSNDVEKLDALLAEKPVPPDSVAAQTGGDPNEVIKIVELAGGLRAQATKDGTITVLDLYNGTDKAYIKTGAPKTPDRFIPPLSERTLAEMAEGRKRIAAHRPPSNAVEEDKSVGTNIPRPGDFIDNQNTFRSPAITPTKVTSSRSM